ncbi:hypothetical protein RJ639_003573, partial [Escallonia herrerae]
LLFRTWKEEISRPAPTENLQHSWLSLPRSLRKLSLIDCNLGDDAFSRIGSINLPSLQELDLSNNPISSQPDFFKGLTGLIGLSLVGTELQIIETQPSLQSLEVHECTSLERIFGPRAEDCEIAAAGCFKLVEIQEYFKWVPLEDLDAETANYLQLYGFQASLDKEVTLYSITAIGLMKGPIQGLHQCGRPFSMFFPGRKIPRMFEFKRKGNSVSFHVPPNLKIHCLHVCCVLTSKGLTRDQVEDRVLVWDSPSSFDEFSIEIKTKDMKVSYDPFFYAIPEPGEDLIWLSFWECGRYNLIAGNKVTVSVLLDGLCFGGKEVGVHLVTYDERELTGCASTSTAPTQSLVKRTLTLCPIEDEDEEQTGCASTSTAQTQSLVKRTRTLCPVDEDEDDNPNAITRKGSIISVQALMPIDATKSLHLLSARHGLIQHLGKTSSELLERRRYSDVHVKRLLFPKLQGKSTSGQYIHGTARTSRVKALFWGPKKAAEPPEMDYLLKDFVLTEFPLKVISSLRKSRQMQIKLKKISVSVVSSILEVSPKDWDACNLDAVGPGNFNPFVTHGFLSSLEESGSAVKETGWIPRHIIARDECENILGVVPLYLKSHSYGLRALRKKQNRITQMEETVSQGKPINKEQEETLKSKPSILAAIDELEKLRQPLSAAVFQVLSLHITFPSASEWHRLKEKGFLQRTGMQYHWKKRNYKNFDKFLMDMKQSKRKNIRQERKKISTQNLTIAFEVMKSREFFHIMGSKLGDHILLVAAEEGDELVAGALNLIGGDAIFGPLWGCLPRAYYPSLHFEACYYQLSSTESLEKKSLARLDQGYASVCLSSTITSQAIEAAIELNLSTVEAGAQGEHKIQRGYLPVTTYSCHYILDEGFREVRDNFLVRETAQVNVLILRIFTAHSGLLFDRVLLVQSFSFYRLRWL